LWRCHQFMSGFLTKGHLSRVSSQSRLSANDKGDNEMMPRAVHRSPDTYLKGEQNKGEHLLGGYTTRHRLKWGFLPPNEVGRIAQNVTKGKGRKERENNPKTADHGAMSCCQKSFKPVWRCHQPYPGS
jgi:hypothetical protein